MTLLLRSPQAGTGGAAAPPSRYKFATLAAPGRADQEADAEREPDDRERPLADRVLQRLLDRAVGLLCGVHHRAAALRHVVDRGIHVLARLAIAAAGLLAGGVGKSIER